jgi:hypothetical protein
MKEEQSISSQLSFDQQRLVQELGQVKSEVYCLQRECKDLREDMLCLMKALGYIFVSQPSQIAVRRKKGRTL